MGISSCTPWQYCRTYGFDFPTSWTITGVRGAEVGRQPYAATTPCNTYTLVSERVTQGQPAQLRISLIVKQSSHINSK